MKINSAFAKGAFCPSCKKYVIGQGNQPDPPWKCAFCDAKICACCYDAHTAKEHPEKYALPEGVLPAWVEESYVVIRQ